MHGASRTSWFIATLGVVAALPAQGRTWVVDFANGPGTHFTDLPPAIAAAADGDLIRVRAGLYTATTIVDKSLTILGGPGVRTWIPAQPLSVTGLAAGKQVVLAGIDNTSAVSALTLTANLGRVILDRMVLANVTVTDCPDVQFNDCALTGRAGALFGGPPPGPALVALRSTLALTGCTVRGAGTNSPATSSPGIVADAARLTIARSVVAGGGGGEVSPNRAGIIATQCALTISGDAASLVESGQTIGAAPAVDTTSGTLTLDPEVTVRGFQSPAIIGSTSVQMTWLPSLRATGAAPGGLISADVFSPAGDLLVFAAGLARSPMDLGALGVLWLDPGALVVTAVAVQGPGRHFGVSTSIPNDPLLLRAVWSQQVLSGTPVGGFRLSNPATISFH